MFFTDTTATYIFNHTPPTAISTLSLHDALPIHRLGARVVFLTGLATFALGSVAAAVAPTALALVAAQALLGVGAALVLRSEEHTAEVQSRQYLVCRLLLEKKK